MRGLFSILIGLPIVYYLVFNPFRANLLTAISDTPDMPANVQFLFLMNAYKLDPCHTTILNKIGDFNIKTANFQMALWAYGKGMECSPGDAIFRIKYGETLNYMGFNGDFALKEAATLEPNNPFFKAELQESLTRHQSQYQ